MPHTMGAPPGFRPSGGNRSRPRDGEARDMAGESGDRRVCLLAPRGTGWHAQSVAMGVVGATNTTTTPFGLTDRRDVPTN